MKMDDNERLPVGFMDLLNWVIILINFDTEQLIYFNLDNGPINLHIGFLLSQKETFFPTKKQLSSSYKEKKPRLNVIQIFLILFSGVIGVFIRLWCCLMHIWDFQSIWTEIIPHMVPIHYTSGKESSKLITDKFVRLTRFFMKCLIEIRMVFVTSAFCTNNFDLVFRYAFYLKLKSNLHIDFLRGLKTLTSFIKRGQILTHQNPMWHMITW